MDQEKRELWKKRIQDYQSSGWSGVRWISVGSFFSSLCVLQSQTGQTENLALGSQRILAVLPSSRTRNVFLARARNDEKSKCTKTPLVIGWAVTGTTTSTFDGNGAYGGVTFTVFPCFWQSCRAHSSYNGDMKKTTDNKLITIEEKEYKKLIGFQQQVEELTAKLQWYEEQFRLSKQRQYGASSEKSSPDQLELPLFNEAEVTADPDVPEPTEETITYVRRKKAGARKAKLENLLTETVEYRLPEEEQVCSCCQGKLHAMSTEVRQKLKVIPAEVKVVKHVRYVYACRHCERHEIETPIVTATMPAPVYPGSLASPSAMAHVMHQKYVEGIPLYRQEKQWERFGIPLSRQTMANWVIYGAHTWLSPLFDRMAEHLRKRDILRADETTLQVLSEPGRAATSHSYMWLYRTGPIGPPIVLYDYQPTRKGQHPKRFLAGFQGYLHVDGYAGYNRMLGACPA